MLRRSPAGERETGVLVLQDNQGIQAFQGKGQQLKSGIDDFSLDGAQRTGWQTWRRGRRGR